MVLGCDDASGAGAYGPTAGSRSRHDLIYTTVTLAGVTRPGTTASLSRHSSRAILLHRWLASLKVEQAVHHIVLEDCIAAVEAAMARRDRLEAHIEAALPEWSLASVVEALQALRGVRLIAAATFGG
jgi:hypothetical protein